MTLKTVNDNKVETRNPVYSGKSSILDPAERDQPLISKKNRFCELFSYYGLFNIIQVFYIVVWIITPLIVIFYKCFYPLQPCLWVIIIISTVSPSPLIYPPDKNRGVGNREIFYVAYPACPGVPLTKQILLDIW